MKDLLDQIRNGLDCGLYYLSLYVALTIPDICGAIDSADGRATKARYIEWFDRYLAHKYTGFLSAEDCYYFCCSLLHQGSSQNPSSTFSGILFIEPSATEITGHCNVMNDALNIDVRIFCNDIVKAAQDWLGCVETTDLYQENVAKMLRRYPSGLAPYIVGVPVIS